MQVTATSYHRLARVIGLTLSTVGLGLAIVFALYLWTGASPLAGSPVDLDGAGLLILATIGAFALPLGVSLLRTDAATSARMRIAAGALGLMALLRLAAFADPELRAIVGVTPLVEFFVLGSISAVAFFVRPRGESPIEMRLEIDIEAPAAQAWRVLGEDFADIGTWAAAIRSSSLDGALQVGAIRTCEIAGFGPVGAGQITEELLELDPATMRFTYAARSGMPRMIHRAENRWSVEALGSGRCRVRSHASVDLAWWALPFASWIGWGMHAGAARFTEELRHRVETGRAHPRKLAAT